MDTHTLTVLEFDKIRRLIRRCLATPIGAQRVDALEPIADRAELDHRRTRLREMRQLLESSSGLPLDGARSIRSFLETARIEGSILEAPALLDILTTCEASGKVRRSVLASDRRIPEIREMVIALEPEQPLQNAISESIASDGTIKDSASKALLRIRKELSALRTHITERVQQILKRRSVQDVLQENFYTQCDGRYVIPIQAQHKSRFRGIIHDRSDTGATVFIEPSEIVPLGNKLRELEVEERRECNRILRALTGRVRHSYSQLSINQEILADLDFLQAVGRYSDMYNMTQPDLADSDPMRLRGARHPLLLAQMPFEKVAPLDLDLAADQSGVAQNVVVVTGPNTGGKTVVIKTAGLLVLMGLAGLDVPVEHGTVIPRFRNVYADIGDEQSLEQSLSTFSSHMSQIIRILDQADEGVLVLLDELGAGTDPIEGGALGIAILDELRSRKATVLVTTHLDDLKVYAHLTERVVNAAMQFDLETLQPTYRLTLGIAGESNALRIAARLGMPASLTDRAEAELAGRETEEAGALYRRLVSEVQTAHQDRQKASQERSQVTRLADEHRKMVQKLEKERHDILHRARIQAQRMVEDARRKVKEAEQAIEWQKQLLAEEREKRVSLEPASQALDAAMAEIGVEEDEPLLNEPELIPIDPNTLKPGDMVQIAGFMKPGKVLKIDRERGEVLLTLSSWEMTLPLARLAQMARPMTPSEQEQTERQQRKPPQASWAYEVKDSPGMELHLRQMRVHEALPLLERYLEDASMAGLDSVRVIHGIGTGAMLRAVHEALRANRLVKSFRLGDASEGAGGATVVTFKES